MTTITCLAETSKYYSDIDAAILELEQNHLLKVLFAAVMGSVSTGFANDSSDVDLFVVFRPLGDVTVATQLPETRYGNTVLHIHMVNISLLNESVVMLDADEVMQNYHSIMPPNFHYKRMFDYEILPGKNNCILAAFMCDVLFNRTIFDKQHFLADCLSDFNHLLGVYSFCKERYVSSYGRLTNYLIEKGNVRLRSYLITIHEVLTLDYILSGDYTLPPQRFTDLVKFCDNDNITAIIKEFYHLNKQAHNIAKNKLLIDPIPELNAYIEKKLEQVKPKLISLYNINPMEIIIVKLEYSLPNHPRSITP